MELKKDKCNIDSVSKSFVEQFPIMEAAYSTRKLHSTINHKCTCDKPEGVKPNGYCYAKDKLGNYVKPCEIGKSLKGILSGADILQ